MIYPNPVKNLTYINFSASNAENITIKVYDQLGRMVDDLGTKLYKKGTYQIPYSIKRSASGNYTIQIVSSTGAIKTHKLIIL